jgi:hypothetical protein
MQLTTFCWKQLRITLLRVCAMYFKRIYLSGTQQYNTIQIFYFQWRSPYQCNQSIIIVLNSLLIVLPERAPSLEIKYLYCIVLLCSREINSLKNLWIKDTPSTWHGLRDQNHFCTRLRRDVCNYRLSLHFSFSIQPELDRSRREIWIGKSDFGHVGHAM